MSLGPRSRLSVRSKAAIGLRNKQRPTQAFGANGTAISTANICEGLSKHVLAQSWVGPIRTRSASRAKGRDRRTFNAVAFQCFRHESGGLDRFYETV